MTTEARSTEGGTLLDGSMNTPRPCRKTKQVWDNGVHWAQLHGPGLQPAPTHSIQVFVFKGKAEWETFKRFHTQAHALPSNKHLPRKPPLETHFHKNPSSCLYFDVLCHPYEEICKVFLICLRAIARVNKTLRKLTMIMCSGWRVSASNGVRESLAECP